MAKRIAPGRSGGAAPSKPMRESAKEQRMDMPMMAMPKAMPPKGMAPKGMPFGAMPKRPKPASGKKR